ncbi:MAG: GIY-YIG nuclease family protein [Sphingomonadaceae bacterium]|nr:GIY-YIG nuclease family protein [Sphingomonadaceae bacterium]
MSFWTYILRCADGSYYTGHTDDLEQRIEQHSSGYYPTCYTFDKRPVELVWAETFTTREDAFAAERQIKGWSRRKKDALIAGDRLHLQRMASRAKVLRDGASTGSAPPQDERMLITTAHPEEAPEPVKGVVSKDPATSPPIIVLVRPQLGENIGKAARAMLNFGLTEMRLVAPRDGWPNPAAGPAASGADIVLANAQVFDTLAEATADISNIYATTVRKRGITKPVITPEAAAREILQNAGRSAILFGAERSGLDSDEVTVARSIVTVPINPDFGSLNLAQAVILCAYEWSKTQSLASPPKTDLDPPASQFELDGLIEQLDSMLEPLGYFTPLDRAPVTRRTLRNLLTKPAWNALEVRTLRGVLTTLARHRRAD